MSKEAISLISERTIKAWNMLLDPTIPHIDFPEPEGHYHFKWRMFKKWVGNSLHKIRLLIFPYTLVRIDNEDEYYE